MRRLGEADYKAIAELSAPSNKPGGSNLGVTSIFNPRVMGARLLSSV